MGRTKQPTDLKQLAAYAKRRGYSVEIKSNHIIARNDRMCIRTGSMETLKKVVA